MIQLDNNLHNNVLIIAKIDFKTKNNLVGS